MRLLLQATDPPLCLRAPLEPVAAGLRPHLEPERRAGLRIAPDRRDLALLEKAFADYAATRIPDLPDESEDEAFLFSAYAQGQFIGGISGKVYWDGLEIDLLWVDADYRGRGYGK